MCCKLVWTDFEEAADSEAFMNRCSLEADRNASFGTGEAAHIFIEGDNYPALKLLQKEFLQKVGIIYIDPPYNTGKAFTFCDALPSTRTSAGNDRHSVWLSFMKRRLEAAKPLLREDGCIFIAIGSEERYRLKLLCDAVFGENNFVNDFMWLQGKGKKDRWSRTMEQSNLCYAKNKKRLNPFTDTAVSDWAEENADNDARGCWFSGSVSFTEARSNPNHRNFYALSSPSGKIWKRQWFIGRAEMETLLAENKIYFGKAPEYAAVPRMKIFNGERKAVIPKNIIDGAGNTRSAQRYVDNLLGARRSFDNPKPVALVRRLIAMTGMPADTLILDFFAGSGTTLEAVAEQNRLDRGRRRCILIQKKESIKTPSAAYPDIATLCRARITRILQTAGALSCFVLKESK